MFASLSTSNVKFILFVFKFSLIPMIADVSSVVTK